MFNQSSYARARLKEIMFAAALTAAFVLVAFFAGASPAHARHHHRHYSGFAITANGDDAQVIGGRPAGCPRLYCGCSASIYLFGRIIPELNLASNWIRKFPRTYPAPGMAAARRHHVMILMSHVDGPNWLVHDGNSGHHLTREHVRSISGYVIVNPDAKRMAGG